MHGWKADAQNLFQVLVKTVDTLLAGRPYPVAHAVQDDVDFVKIALLLLLEQLL